MKFLGVDFGSKRVGLAVSDDGGRLAFPKTVLQNNADLIEEMKKICREENVKKIIIGESLDLSGVPNPIMGQITEFKKKIEAETNLPTDLQKEFMTSVEARRPKNGKDIFTARKTSQEKPKDVDASAAALILQRYLDKVNR